MPKFFKSSFKNNLEDEEKSYLESFKSLFTSTMGKLLILNVEYRKGFKDEWMRYIDAKTLEQFDNILELAQRLWKESKARNFIVPTPMFPHFKNPEQYIKEFETYLKIALGEIKIKVVDSIISGEVTESDIYRRRTELIKTLKSKKADFEEEAQKLKDSEPNKSL